MFTAKVITVSDRSAAGQRADSSGPMLCELLKEQGYHVLPPVIVPDEQSAIEHALVESAAEDIALVLTTGGTGFSPRDVTPEATCRVCEKAVPGIAEAMRYASLQITPRAMLSRATAGIRGRTLIVNLPGSPKAARENWQAVAAAIPHGLEILRNGPADCGAADK